MKKLATLVLTLTVCSNCVAFEKNQERTIAFGNKYKIQLDEKVSVGFAYTDKKFCLDRASKRFAQKWAVGLDVKQVFADPSIKFGFRLGYDDAGRSQANAIGIAIGKSF